MDIPSLSRLDPKVQARVVDELTRRNIDIATCDVDIGTTIHVYHKAEAMRTPGHVVLFLSGRFICWIKPQ